MVNNYYKLGLSPKCTIKIIFCLAFGSIKWDFTGTLSAWFPADIHTVDSGVHNHSVFGGYQWLSCRFPPRKM